MPIEFTQEEKDEIIRKHKNLVDEFYQYLPEENKIEYDNSLIDKLNDEKEVKYYKALDEARLRIAKQRQIYQNLEARFGAIPENKNILNRSFQFGFKTSGSTEDNEYNEKLYKEYQKDPERVFYQRYKKVMEFNPQELINIGNDTQKLVEFYLKNQRLLEDAFVFNSQMDNSNAKINPALKNALTGMTKAIEDITYPMDIVKREMGETYFTFPKNMTQEQAVIITASHPQYFAKESPYNGMFNKIINPAEENLHPEQPLINYKNNGFKMSKNFFVKYKALQRDAQTGVTREISLEEGIRRRNEEGIEIKERTNEEVMELKKINSTFDREYLKIWQRKFSNNFDHQEFNFERLKLAHQGNVVERFLRRTSREYKLFIEQFEKYNDPNSPDFLNKDKLKTRAQAYYDHKAEQGISLNDMDETGRNRLKFVSAVIQTIDQTDYYKNDTLNEVNDSLREEDDIEREQFLEDSDLENDDMAVDLDDSMAISEDLELRN